MKKSGQSKMKVQLYEGLLVVVIIVVIVVLVLAVRSDKKNIEKTFDNRGCRTKKLVRCPFFYVNVVYNLKNKSQASKTLGFMVKY